VIKTAFTKLIGVEHPIALAGMGGGTSPELVAAVTNAGGLGLLGVSSDSPEDLTRHVADTRARTDGPFGLNLLLHFATDDELRAVLDAKPAILSTAWAGDHQNLTEIFNLAHERGVKVMHMVPSAADAEKAAAAGADVIVAQGTDGGGHIGLMGTAVVVPMVTRAVAPVPVLAAGGIADGRGLAAMLALGAAGVLVGTRFLATVESPIHNAFKKLIVDSDGSDTLVTDLADIFLGNEWPGALARIARNRLVERWLGRTNELRRRRDELMPLMQEARKNGDVEETILYWGQSAGLIHEIVPAGQVVADMVHEAESLLRNRLPSLVVD